MAAYYKVDVSLSTNSVTVGAPSAQEVLVTLPLVGPAGATGATGATGPSGASTWNEISGKPALFPPSAHEHQPDQVYADAAFVSQSGDSSSQIGIYLRNGSDNGRPVYESPTTGDYIWWDSELEQWYLTSNTDVNLYYLDENVDDFPWETDVVWNAIPPQTGNIEVDQAFLSDISDYSSASVIGLKTSKSGNASSTELVLGNDTRLTNSRTPSSTLAHASSHHTGGTDAIAPNNISAAWAQTTTSATLTDGSTTEISASRNVRYEFVYSGSSVTTIRLSSTGNSASDEIVVTWVAGGTTGNLPVQRFDGFSWSTIATITSRPSSLRFRFTTAWALVAVDTHTQAASTITGLGTAATANLDALPETLRIVGGTDPTKKLAFELDTLVDTATTRTLTVPNSSGTIALNETFAAPPSIGNTTANSGAFTTLNATSTTELVNGGTTAGPFRVYNTSSSSNANFERLSLRWASNVAIIGTEKLGTGSARALEFQTDGTTRMAISTTGLVNISATGNAALSVTSTTGAGDGAYFSAIGQKESFFNLFANGNASGSRLMRFGNTDSGTFIVQALNDAGTAVLRTPLSIANTAPTGAFSIDGSGGVGIGGSAPAKLTVAGSFGVQGVTGVPSSGFGVEISNTADISYVGAYNRSTFVYRDLLLFGKDLILETGGTQRMRILSTGNVGIGTASPTANLHVVGTVLVGGTLTVADANNIAVGTTTGTKIGTATGQKIGFFNATPVVQQSGTGTNETGFTANGPSNTVHANSTFTGNVGATAYSISDIVKHLKTIGLIAS